MRPTRQFLRWPPAAALTLAGALTLGIWGLGSAAHGAGLLDEKVFEKALRTARGVSPNKRSYSDGRTALMGLALNKNLSPDEKEAVARRIVERGADLGLIDDTGNTVLHFAVTSGAPALARYLIERGADRDFPNLAGDTPFQLALRSKDPVMVALFLDNASIVDNRNAAGVSALFEAAVEGDLAVVKRLVALGANPGRSEKSALLGAVIARRMPVVRYLIEDARLSADLRSEDGETPLMGAAAIGDLETAKYLVGKHQADVNAISDKGGTPLRFAAQGGHKAVLEFLIEHGADPEKSIPTALGAAAQHGQIEVVQWLAAHGAKLGPGTPESPGALYWALLGGSFDAARALVQLKAAFPALPVGTPPLLKAEIEREFARGRHAAGDAPAASSHLMSSAANLDLLAGKLREKGREAHNKANVQLALRIALTVLAAAAEAGEIQVQSTQARTLAQIAALRHSANHGTGLSGYHTYMAAHNRSAAATRKAPASSPPIPDVTAGEGSGSLRTQAREFEAQAQRFSDQAAQLRAVADCLRTLAPGASVSGCPPVPDSDANATQPPPSAR